MAGFAGSNVFKAKDAPRYKDGLIVCGVSSVVGGIIMLIWKLLYIWDEKRAQGRRRGGSSPELVSYVLYISFALCVCFERERYVDFFFLRRRFTVSQRRGLLKRR